MTENQKQQIVIMRTRCMGYSEIAEKLGLSKNSVRSYCANHNLSGQMAVSGRKSKDYTGFVCKNCGKPIVSLPGRKPKKFCSDKCRLSWWNAHPDKVNKTAFYSFRCPVCNKEFTSYGNNHRKFCCFDCYIKDRFYKDKLAG